MIEIKKIIAHLLLDEEMVSKETLTYLACYRF